MTQEKKNKVLEQMVELLELPDSAYEKAKKRYDDLSEWFDRDESTIKGYNPHIFSQGSFRLGTAIRPLDEKEEYDLDLACKLKKDVTKLSHTQEEVKTMLQAELETYRIARGIKSPLEEKHRCWRLEYQDDLSFHMDIVPCIPEEYEKQQYIYDAMFAAGMDMHIARKASETTVAITDDRDSSYDVINLDWNISNPEGYAVWFQDRMFPLTYQRGMILDAVQIDDIPMYKRKTPLQRAIQLLKRHRDNMFKDDPDVKPISIIIATLATRVYSGENDLESTLRNILIKMENLVHSSTPRVPNPVDPEEDFADRWSMPAYAHLRLEDNFWHWLKQAQNDFEIITSQANHDFIMGQAKSKFSLNIGKSMLIPILGLETSNTDVFEKPNIIEQSEVAKPWQKI